MSPLGNDVLKAAAARLGDAGIENGQGDALALMTHAFGRDVSRLALREALAGALPPDVAARFEAAISARLIRQPVSQIIGRRAFWNREFIVTPDVLDPRPETETLIAEALELPFNRFLDLGTGSGAIAITLLDERAGATGVATDISPAALAVARRNAAAIGVADRLDLVQSDWCAGLTGTFDLILSNPPYIAAAEMPSLSPEVRDWEPHLALTPGGDGLDAYRAICASAPAHLAPDGWLMVEVGWQQGPAVAEIFGAAGLEDVATRPDLGNRDRVVRGRKPATHQP
ncbi:peptide chain release factor N(5)-glutamine methyltransferase [Pseudooceanicola algae]|uniref:Release factor glutamine methyltransferase n=1 Tax=Pseudooceanicola algae TaxID=1537215 RepID=A0A418SDV7_9RHOB|nr:peptide chain release factor N(5)-glutamine methyltransferase [Pseudooceanicola algae]QPM89544.1 Release factor glutamine methyltransferase [Pseudooceanicola algae]